ncbi:uncharacterized protein PFL1_01400 [Pseudozyma flocculosa PF-1]|uniref:Uncharacterized protein n=1 Tax=Pseudozyma flocculosa TaxID=84751 RepID=A0A5C3EW79_9BASI|nr:uncharacterized protein PFL1_01400 [Pseudozyma flocculosa PF-1]EPQ31213.1 hypothetical protein PFL1_01400 [Pseudozyma flocculosa PF-1]SPO36292.1 uncharacterized protein PSFLO_01763 [Pseudozyma flocculosa]
MDATPSPIQSEMARRLDSLEADIRGMRTMVFGLAGYVDMLSGGMKSLIKVIEVNQQLCLQGHLRDESTDADASLSAEGPEEEEDEEEDDKDEEAEGRDEDQARPSSVVRPPIVNDRIATAAPAPAAGAATTKDVRSPSPPRPAKRKRPASRHSGDTRPASQRPPLQGQGGGAGQPGATSHLDPTSKLRKLTTELLSEHQQHPSAHQTCPALGPSATRQDQHQHQGQAQAQAQAQAQGHDLDAGEGEGEGSNASMRTVERVQSWLRQQLQHQSPGNGQPGVGQTAEARLARETEKLRQLAAQKHFEPSHIVGGSKLGSSHQELDRKLDGIARQTAGWMDAVHRGDLRALASAASPPMPPAAELPGASRHIDYTEGPDEQRLPWPPEPESRVSRVGRVERPAQTGATGTQQQ